MKVFLLVVAHEKNQIILQAYYLDYIHVRVYRAYRFENILDYTNLRVFDFLLLLNTLHVPYANCNSLLIDEYFQNHTFGLKDKKVSI